MTESKFRERRSAFRDESVDEPVDESAPPPIVEPLGQAPEMPSPDAPAAPPEAEERLVSSLGTADPYAPPPEAVAAELDRLAEMDIPPPSFLELVEPHVERAFGFLGELPLTPDGERRVIPRLAKHEIDLLGILEERTRGNLPPEEQRVLAEVLDELRTLYLKVVE